LAVFVAIQVVLCGFDEPLAKTLSISQQRGVKPAFQIEGQIDDDSITAAYSHACNVTYITSHVKRMPNDATYSL
jgi:hypothetical protein